MDSALRSLASERGSDSVSNFSCKSAPTQNTQTERINAMITEMLMLEKLSTTIYLEIIWNPHYHQFIIIIIIIR